MEKKFNLSKFKIGLRTIKTAVAVFLCLILQLLLPMSMHDAFYACIAAVVVMRETAKESLTSGTNRFLGTLIGGFIGFLLINIRTGIPYYNEWLYILLVPLGVLVCIYTCVHLKREDTVVICSVVFIGIAMDPTLNPKHTLSYVFYRVVFTSLGIVIATLINKYFFPYSGAGEIEGEQEDKQEDRSK